MEAPSESIEASKVLRAHQSYVFCVAFSPDGGFVFSASNDGTVRIWNRHTGAELFILKGHKDYIMAVAVAPDARFVVTGSGDNTARMWTKTSRRGRFTLHSRHVLRGHKGSVVAIAISSNFRFIVTASWDATAKIWNSFSREELHTLRGHRGGVYGVAVAPGDDFVVTTSADKTARIWDPHSAVALRVLAGHEDIVYAAAVAPDGSYVVTASEDRTARLWDPKSGEEKHVLKGHSDSVRSVDVSRDGRFVVTGSWDNTVLMFDPESGAVIHAFRGHTHSVNSVAISKDGTAIATGSADHTVMIWNLEGTCMGLSPFFEVVKEAVKDGTAVEEVLRRLCNTCTDVQELKLFYTAVSVSCKVGDITEEKRNELINEALLRVPVAMRFDRERMVFNALTYILQQAVSDSVIQADDATRLGNKYIREGGVYERQFRSLEQTIRGHCQRPRPMSPRLMNVEARRRHLENYLQQVNDELLKFKREFRRHPERDAAVSLLAVIVSIITLGMGTSVVDAIWKTSSSILDRVVDFSNCAHVLNIATANALVADDDVKGLAKIGDEEESWDKPPLEKAWKNRNIKESAMPMLAMYQVALIVDAKIEKEKTPAPSPTPSPTPSPPASPKPPEPKTPAPKAPAPKAPAGLVQMTPQETLRAELQGFQEMLDVGLMNEDEFRSMKTEAYERYRTTIRESRSSETIQIMCMSPAIKEEKED